MPKTEPWGTPCKIGIVSEIASKICKYCFLDSRYDCNKFKYIPLMPYLSSFSTSRDILAVSNALGLFSVNYESMKNIKHTIRNPFQYCPDKPNAVIIIRMH